MVRYLGTEIDYITMPPTTTVQRLQNAERHVLDHLALPGKELSSARPDSPTGKAHLCTPFPRLSAYDLLSRPVCPTLTFGRQ